jgi:hypothetical protein
MEKRMREEEELRRCGREKLATVGHARYFNEKEKQMSRMMFGLDYFRANPCYRARAATRRRRELDQDGNARRAATDQRAFPRPHAYVRRRSGYRRSRENTYESLGEGRNFFVLAADSGKANGERYVFTVFPASGSVVATGLRSFPSWFDPEKPADEAPEVIRTFSELTGIPSSEIHGLRVTNSTWSGSLRPHGATPESLGSVMRVISDYSRSMSGGELSGLVSIDFRSQFFPGVRLQLGGVRGTINLFNNGSFVIVGARRASEAMVHLRWLAAIMNECWKKPGAGTSYAWTAA